MSRLFFRHGLVMALTAGLGLTFQALPAQAAPADVVVDAVTYRSTRMRPDRGRR